MADLTDRLLNALRAWDGDSGMIEASGDWLSFDVHGPRGDLEVALADSHWTVPAPVFDPEQARGGAALPAGWLMLICGPVLTGGPDEVLCGWDANDTFHQYADTETIARALVSYLQDVIHV